jgi:hypothetical protein
VRFRLIPMSALKRHPLKVSSGMKSKSEVSTLSSLVPPTEILKGSRTRPDGLSSASSSTVRRPSILGPARSKLSLGRTVQSAGNSNVRGRDVHFARASARLVRKSSKLLIFIAPRTCTVFSSQIFYIARLADFLVTLHAFLSSISSFFFLINPVTRQYELRKREFQRSVSYITDKEFTYCALNSKSMVPGNGMLSAINHLKIYETRLLDYRKKQYT